jgi:hypothetical protein
MADNKGMFHTTQILPQLTNFYCANTADTYLIYVTTYKIFRYLHSQCRKAPWLSHIAFKETV